jgi:hypothetical protein
MSTFNIYSFNKYTISYYSGSTFEAVINLQQDGQFVGGIAFVKDNAVIPTNFAYTGGQGIQIHFPISSFNNIYTILRKEKPLYLYVSSDHRAGWLVAREEPVGEEEGK